MSRRLRLYRPDRLPPRHRANVVPEGQETPYWAVCLLRLFAVAALWMLLRAVDHALFIGAGVGR
jgi:hypothetical protein